jgi:hypothetical protein
MDAMSVLKTVLKPDCLARAGAIPCRGCGACGRSAGDRVPAVPATERARVARDDFRNLRGLSVADAAVTGGAGDHANSIRRRRHVTTGDAAVAALKREWALNKVNEHGVTLQDEFEGDFEVFAAYARHRDAGYVTILERKDSRCQSRADTALSAVLSTAVLRSEWDQNAPDALGVRPQTEFGGDFEAYCAYCRAVARGGVRMACPSPGVIKG